MWLGTANGRLNMFDRFAGGGLKVSGWVPRREQDEFGIAISAAFTSDSWRAGTSAGSSEIAVDMTYRAPVTPWLAVQPSLHYVRNHSAERGIADALVIGLRAEGNLSSWAAERPFYIQVCRYRSGWWPISAHGCPATNC